MAYFEIIMLLFTFIFFCYSYSNKNGIPTNWPIVGMLPALFKNIHRIHDFVIEVAHETNMSFHFIGPWFTNMDMLTTSDPANVHYVMSKNFGNYPKGSKFREIFDVLGDGIFNTDANIWQYHRKMVHAFLGHPKFHHYLVEKIWDKVECGLIPVLDHASNKGIEIDLQDLFERFTFDNICNIVMGHDPKSLSTEFQSSPASKALDDIERAILYRHALPKCIWKLLKWLNVGEEKTYKKAWKTLDNFIYKFIAKKREDMSTLGYMVDSPLVNEGRVSPTKKDPHLDVDLLTFYIMNENNNETNIIPKDTCNMKGDKFLRDTVLNIFIAGRDTTSTALSWFFYLLSKNPLVVGKIREELDKVMMNRQTMHGNNNNNVSYNMSKDTKELNCKLVYLHASLCEALRLYPPVVFQSKTPCEPDTLPSGHKVTPNMQVIFDMYSMARMRSVWGEDCCEFKPDRWISERGKIKYEPSYKFFAFNAGPRTCVGKDMAFTQMKAVAAIIIQKYKFEAVESCVVVPDTSIILRMKYGFKVRVLKLSV